MYLEVEVRESFIEQGEPHLQEAAWNEQSQASAYSYPSLVDGSSLKSCETPDTILKFLGWTMLLWKSSTKESV